MPVLFLQLFVLAPIENVLECEDEIFRKIYFTRFVAVYTLYFISQVCYTSISLIHIIFFLFLQFLVELKLYVITATATVVVNFSTTALQPQPRFFKNSQPTHH